MNKHESMVYYKFSQAAQDLIKFHGGEPPRGFYLCVEHAELDTNENKLLITYTFYPYPEDDEEEE